MQTFLELLSRRETGIEDIDDFVDQVIREIDEKTNTLNLRLAQVLHKKYKGNLLRFSMDVSTVVEEAACDQCDQLTCEAAKAALLRWAEKQVGIKRGKAKLTRVH